MVTVLLWPAFLCAQATSPAVPGTEVRVRVEAAPNTEACPGRALLEAALQPVFVNAHVVVLSDVDATDARVTVRDLGESYVVNVGEATRTVVDAARDCVERARVTAVFAALNLPATSAAPATANPAVNAAVASESEPTAEPTPASGSDPLLSGVGVMLFGSAQLPTENGQLTGGAGLGVGWISGSWRVGLDATWLSRSTQQLRADASSAVPDARVSTSRLPFAISATHLFPLGSMSVGPSLGAVFDVLWMRGEQVMRPQRETRLNLGARLSLDARLRLSQAWHGVFQVNAWVYPRAYQLSVEPTDEAGRTPRLWIGANLGLEWRFGEFDTPE